jgi:hypothetical protein
MRYFGIVSFAVLGIVSFAVLVLAISTPTQADSADDKALAIAHLAFRDHIVTISSSPRGPRYSVRTSSGTLLGEDLTEDQLLAAHPKLHSQIRSSVASDESGGFIWAGRSEGLIEPAVDAATNPD